MSLYCSYPRCHVAKAINCMSNREGAKNGGGKTSETQAEDVWASSEEDYEFII